MDSLYDLYRLVIVRLTTYITHTTVDRKGILAGAILSAAHTMINYYAQDASYYKFGHR